MESDNMIEVLLVYTEYWDGISWKFVLGTDNSLIITSNLKKKKILKENNKIMYHSWRLI